MQPPQVGYRLGNWDLLLPTAKFAYHNSVNTSMGKPIWDSPWFFPFQPVDLLPLPLKFRSSESVESFAQHSHSLHANIRCKIALSWKLRTCWWRSRQESRIQWGSLFWFVFFLNLTQKLPSRNCKPEPLDSHRVIRRVGPSAYFLYLTCDLIWASSLILNMVDLFPY